jgi:putative heme transporter
VGTTLYARAVGERSPDAGSSMGAEIAGSGQGPGRWSLRRSIILVVTGLCLYVFGPSLADVFAAWDRLGEVHPASVLAVLALEVASFWCIWWLQRTALRTKTWFPIVTSQLAGNAFNRITPGGGATGTALQVRMLVDAGFDTTMTASALTWQSVLISATVAALPILILPAIVGGMSVPGGLADAAWIGLAVFVIIGAFGALLLGTRRPVCWLGERIERIVNALRPRRPPIVGLGAKLLAERDEIRATMGTRWLQALGASVGRWAFEYFALLVTLYAIGADPNPWLVLLAFVAASVLGMLPFTPGGLGFVEAGLTGALALSGVTTTQAVLATLVFRLVSFWLPLPIGAAAAVAFRRRYPHRSHPSATANP